MDATAITLASQEKQSQLTHRVSELENEIVELKNWSKEADRYQLTEIGPKAYAFTLKQGKEEGEPPHRLCTACYGKRQKGYLQFYKQDGYGDYFKCDLCQNEVLCFSKEYLTDYCPVRFV